MSAPAAASDLKLLHVAAEVFPLVKTGGLADVAAALPPALARAGADTRLLLPGLPPIVDALSPAAEVCRFGPLFGAAACGSSGVGSAIASGPSKYSRCVFVDQPMRNIQLSDMRLVAASSMPQ